MHNVEISPVDSFSSLSLFREPTVGPEHFVDTPSSVSSLDRAVPTVDVQHAALQALLSPVLDAELTIPFRNCGNPQPYFPYTPTNHSSSLHQHHVHLSDSLSSHLPSLLNQHDLNALNPIQHVPVTPLTFLSGSASSTNPSYGSPLHQSIQQIPSSSSQYLSTHQPADLGDLSISQQIDFDTICSDYLTMVSSPTRMDSPTKGELISPAVSAGSPPSEDEAAAKAILEVIEGVFVTDLSKDIVD